MLLKTIASAERIYIYIYEIIHLVKSLLVLFLQWIININLMKSNDQAYSSQRVEVRSRRLIWLSLRLQWDTFGHLFVCFAWVHHEMCELISTKSENYIWDWWHFYCNFKRRTIWDFVHLSVQEKKLRNRRVCLISILGFLENSYLWGRNKWSISLY